MTGAVSVTYYRSYVPQFVQIFLHLTIRHTDVSALESCIPFSVNRIRKTVSSCQTRNWTEYG